MNAINITHQHADGRLQPRDPDAVISWDEMLVHLSTGLQAWLTVVEDDGTPIVRPVLAALVDGALHLSSSPWTRKAGRLDAGTPATLAAATDGLDVVWSGTPARVTDADAIDRVAATYRDRHGWDVARSGAALDAPYGAPTAGPPPYAVYRIDPITVHAFGTSADLAGRSTRWGPPTIERSSTW